MAKLWDKLGRGGKRSWALSFKAIEATTTTTAEAMATAEQRNLDDDIPWK